MKTILLILFAITILFVAFIFTAIVLVNKFRLPLFDGEAYEDPYDESFEEYKTFFINKSETDD